jgi:hypothetical protein
VSLPELAHTDGLLQGDTPTFINGIFVNSESLIRFAEIFWKQTAFNLPILRNEKEKP